MATDRPAAERVQSVRNAWINALRDETLRVQNKEQARVAHVGQMIATYANADGSNAWPSRETLAVLCGCTTETVTRAVAVLMAVGMLAKKRRPNAPTAYQLLMPVTRPDWAAHMHLYTETRQKKAHATKKARELEELLAARTASRDAHRTASTDCVPDSVHGGGSGQRPATPSADPDSVHGRPWTASTDAIRTASMAGGYQYRPTSGRDPQPHHTLPDHPQQPQVRARTRPENDQHAAEPPPSEPAANWTRCTGCGGPMYPRPGRPDHHAHCTPNAA